MDVLRELGAVLAVFGLLGLLLYLGRRGQWITTSLRRPGAGTRSLQVVETLRLTPQHLIHVVRAGKRTMIVATHSAGCTVLRDQEGDPEQLK